MGKTIKCIGCGEFFEGNDVGRPRLYCMACRVERRVARHPQRIFIKPSKLIQCPRCKGKATVRTGAGLRLYSITFKCEACGLILEDVREKGLED